MKFLKNNLKVIIIFIVGIVLASGISVYTTATYLYNAKDVSYTNDKSVADALNDLYIKSVSDPKYDTLFYNSYKSTYTYDYTITEENTEYKYLMIIAYSANISMSSSPAYINIKNDNIIPILNPDYMEQIEYGNMRSSSDVYVGIINKPIKDDIISINNYYSGQILILGIKQ